MNDPVPFDSDPGLASREGSDFAKFMADYADQAGEEAPTEDRIDAEGFIDYSREPVFTPEEPAESAGTAGEAATGATSEQEVSQGVSDGEAGDSSSGLAGLDTRVSTTDADGSTGGDTNPGDVRAAAAPVDWQNVLEGFEERVRETAQRDSFETLRADYSKYFELLRLDPRELIGSEVPNVTDPEQMDVIRDSRDAQDWQRAVKSILARELDERTEKNLAELRPATDVVSNAIQLFSANPDISPVSPEFDVELAREFVSLVKPYERRDREGKLTGYNIEVQPLLNTLRERRKQAAAAAPAGTDRARDDAGRFTAERPQVGVRSGSSSVPAETEDYSTLFRMAGVSDQTKYWK